MPLTPERSFDPDTLKCMGNAFEVVCTQLGLIDKDHPTQLVAERVIAFAEQGDNDPAALCDRGLGYCPNALKASNSRSRLGRPVSALPREDAELQNSSRSGCQTFPMSA